LDKLSKEKSEIKTVEVLFKKIRAVRLNRNQRQSRAEERMLGKNVAHQGGNAQPREGYGGGSYGGREGQIM